MDEAARDTQVTVQLREMNEICADIEEAISALDTRLSAVLTNEPEEKAINTADDVNLVPLADDLNHKNRVLRGLLARLHNLRHRIEL
jgi:hypothetical protein